MNWLDWLKGDGLELLKKIGLGLINLITFTLFYFAGKKSKQQEVEKELAQEALKYHGEVDEKREKTRKKFNELRQKNPDQWLDDPGARGMRKNNKG